MAPGTNLEGPRRATELLDPSQKSTDFLRPQRRGLSMNTGGQIDVQSLGCALKILTHEIRSSDRHTRPNRYPEKWPAPGDMHTPSISNPTQDDAAFSAISAEVTCHPSVCLLCVCCSHFSLSLNREARLSSLNLRQQGKKKEFAARRRLVNFQNDESWRLSNRCFFTQVESGIRTRPSTVMQRLSLIHI